MLHTHTHSNNAQALACTEHAQACMHFYMYMNKFPLCVLDNFAWMVTEVAITSKKLRELL